MRSVCDQIREATHSFPIFPDTRPVPAPVATLIDGLRHDAPLFASIGDHASAERLQAAVRALSRSTYDLDVFVRKSITPSLRADLEAGLREIPGVGSVVYWSSKKLRKKAAALTPNAPLLNPGTSSSLFELSLSGRADLGSTMNQIASLPHTLDAGITASNSFIDALRPIAALCPPGFLSTPSG
jgi:hypothetical protein